MIKDIGEIGMSHSDDANIPINIWLVRIGESEEYYSTGYRWQLSASNYMPRKSRLSEDSYLVISDNREELTDLIQKHIIPLYENALNKLQGMIKGTNDSLYYWDKSDNID